ncbi:NaeI family type II restriction endonuclease [Streptomyces sp. NPDC004327]|uniref:NaeI family type II restriction endonuclease n=1 Tax=Streptomyces sp. NPDC004327 TaxID=3364699 RepID=UPI0036879819
MPDPLPRLLSALRAAAPELDGTALAEALWLAALRADQAGEAVRDTAGPRSGADAPRPAGQDRPREPDTGADRDPRTPKAPTREAEPHAPARPGAGTRPLHERLPGSAAPLRGHAVAAPHAAGLPRALELTRALRPWKRRWPEGRRGELDIDATVDGYARSGELIPVVTAAPERWFDLVLVVDRSPGMRVWAETVAEFSAVLDRLGAFRTLQVADLTFDAHGTPRAPGALRSADGRRLVVVVSDCMADAWRRPDVWHLLRAWAGAHPTAVLNPLPTRLWRRGGLDLPTARFTPAAPGSPRGRVPVAPPALLASEDETAAGTWLPVPVLSLTPHSLGRWSRTLMRGDPEGCTAVLVPPTGRTTAGPARPRTVPLPPAERARRFLRTASPRAARLAVLCAPFDRFSLRLLHLVREKLVPDAQIADVAEVVTSGVFEVTGHTGGPVELALPPDARSVLREHLPAHEVWALHQALDRHIADRGTSRTRLPSVAYDGEGPHDLAAEKEAFARASRRTLELLGLAEPEPSVTEAPEAPEDEPGLPPAPEPFVGTARTTADELVEQLATGKVRAVHVTAWDGVPGAGRTTLALHVAHRVRERFPDGALFVPLRGSTPHPVAPEAALDRILHDIGARRESPGDTTPRPEELTARLHQALSGRRVLLVMDDIGTDERARALATVPPEGCAVIATSRGEIPSALLAAEVHLLGLLGEDAGRLLAAGGAPRPDAVAAGRWWPLTLRILGGALASPDPVISARAARILTESRSAGSPPPASVVRHWLDELSEGRATTLVRLAEAAASEFTLEEAAAVLDRSPDSAAAHLDTLVRDGLLDRPGPGRYVFPAVVHDEVRATPGYDARREVARARISRFHQAAAAALHEDWHPGSTLPARLGIVPEPAPRAGVWVRNALEFAYAAPETLLLLTDVAGMPAHLPAFRRAAEHWIGLSPEHGGSVRGRAAIALARTALALGRPDDAWEILHRVSHSDLEADEATFGLAALVIARIVLTLWPQDGARDAISWAREALAWHGGASSAPEAGEALLCLEQALTVHREDEELLVVQGELSTHFRTRGLLSESGRVHLRTAETLLRLGRRDQAARAVRGGLTLLDPVRDAAERHEAERLLRLAADPARIVIAIGASAASRSRLVSESAALLGGLASVGPGRFDSHAFQDCLLLLIDAAVPLAPLLAELTDRLPAVRMAVHRGPVVEPPAADAAVEYTRTMLRGADFVRVSENYPDDTTLCVSPEAYETLSHDTANSALAHRLTPRDVRTENGTVVCVILTPQVDLSAWDAELLALARLFNELDPQGGILARTLRDTFDSALAARGTDRFDLGDLGMVEAAGISLDLERRLGEGAFPFRRGPSGPLTWERAGRSVPLHAQVVLHGPDRESGDRRPSDRMCLLAYVDEAGSRWSAGLVRGGPPRVPPGSVLWLHRDAALPENVLLGLAADARAAVLAGPDDVTRVAELFRRVRRHPVHASALRPLVHERDGDRARERAVRLAAAALRAEGLLLLAANARGRAMAEALRLPALPDDTYLCAPLTPRTPAHGSRPSVTVDGTAWVLADDGDAAVPIPTGFPGLRTR